MSTESVYEPGYAAKLKADPRGELEKLGITPTDDLLAKIDEFSVADLAHAIQLLKAGAEATGRSLSEAWP